MFFITEIPFHPGLLQESNIGKRKVKKEIKCHRYEIYINGMPNPDSFRMPSVTMEGLGRKLYLCNIIKNQKWKEK